MRLLELEICNFRGVRHLEIKPEGNTFAILGPNGVGKSTAADALDFLLTGTISRLTGEGTKNVSLRGHGPHIDSEPESSYVKVVIQGPSDHRITLHRALSSSGTLDYDDQWSHIVEPICAAAKRRYFMLTRRDILRYINAEPGKRSEQIKAILNLSLADNIRKTLGSAMRELAKRKGIDHQTVQQAEANVAAVLDLSSYTDSLALDAANVHLLSLGLPALSGLENGILLEQSNQCSDNADHPAPSTLRIEAHLERLMESLSDPEIDLLNHHESQLRADLEFLISDQDLINDAQYFELLTTADSLIDNTTTTCPVCATSFKDGELAQILALQISRVGDGYQAMQRVKSTSTLIRTTLINVRPHVDAVASSCEALGLQQEYRFFLGWIGSCTSELEFLIRPLDAYVGGAAKSSCEAVLGLKELREKLVEVSDLLIQQSPVKSPEQEARDALIRLELRLGDLSRAQGRLRLSLSAAANAKSISEAFNRAQDSTLNDLYQQVEERFSAYYNLIHPDEVVDAQIHQAGASLEFTIDFFGRGHSVPQAMHSEGHQDTMGVCLFLALSEVLHPEGLDFIVLDDVITSVDSDHRRYVCDLLYKHFGHRQLLITSHDRNWINELRFRGVVGDGRITEFYGWSIDDGPSYSANLDMWSRVDEHLSRNDVPTAAFHLRRGMEELSIHACDLLGASVTFKLGGSWELGELLPAASSQYRKLLNKAKNRASKEKRQDDLETLDTLYTKWSDINQRLRVDQWMINASVHFNSWSGLSSNELAEIVAACRDFRDLIQCSNCNQPIRGIPKGKDPQVVQCRCLKTNWNL